MEQYIKALEIKEDFSIKPGHKIKIYGQETIVKGFYPSYNDGLEKWETIIITEGRGDPFERSLNAIEVLPDQPCGPWPGLPPLPEPILTDEDVKELPVKDGGLKASQGAVWVRASTTPPVCDPVCFAKIKDNLVEDNIRHVVLCPEARPGHWIAFGLQLKISVKLDEIIEWLCESNEQPVEQKENEAVALAEWLRKNHYAVYGNNWRKNGSNLEKSTEQLYNEYQKQNKR